MDEQEINSISGHHQLDLDESESKSPLSQESGLCSTVRVAAIHTYMHRNIHQMISL